MRETKSEINRSPRNPVCIMVNPEVEVLPSPGRSAGLVTLPTGRGYETIVQQGTIVEVGGPQSSGFVQGNNRQREIRSIC